MATPVGLGGGRSARLRPLLDEEEGWDYGSILPLARNRETGAIGLGVPGIVREPAQALLGLFDEYVAAQEGDGFDPGAVTEGVASLPATSLLAGPVKGGATLGSTILWRGRRTRLPDSGVDFLKSKFRAGSRAKDTDLPIGHTPDAGDALDWLITRASTHGRESIEPFRSGGYLTPLTTLAPEEPDVAFKVANKPAPHLIEANQEALDRLLLRHPDPTASLEDWQRYQAELRGSRIVPASPFNFLRMVNTPGELARAVRDVPPEMVDAAQKGFDNAAKIAERLRTGQAGNSDIAKMVLWGSLSKGVSAWPHEAGFIDAIVEDADQWIRRAEEGKFDLQAFRRWARDVSPPDTPGRSVQHNLNAWAEHFLDKVTRRLPGQNMNGLDQLTEAFADPSKKATDVVRAAAKLGSIGIDNKVVLFLGLVAGKADSVVPDRINTTDMIDDGRFGGRNIYDTRSIRNPDTPTGKPEHQITGSGTNSAFYGLHGTGYIEPINRRLERDLPQAFADAGRDPLDGVPGRWHWERWQHKSGQVVEHPTIATFAGEDPRQMWIPEGRYNYFQHGLRYGRPGGEPMYRYALPDGREIEMTPAQAKRFFDEIRKPANRIVPRGFKVSESLDRPWTEQPGVDQQGIIALARRLGLL